MQPLGFIKLRSKPLPIPPPPKPLHSLIATLQGEAHLQSSSPLFSTVPAEIRNTIFLLALCSYDDKSAPYPENTHYSRPGYRFRHRIDTALLSTCRRIYRETHILPVQLNEHLFWCSKGRGPPGVVFCDNPVGQLSRLTVEQREALKTVHLFTQMFWLEGSFPSVCKSDVFRMKHLKITIRQGDWWFWEDNRPLNMKNEWTSSLKAIGTLERFEMELEVIERDKSQLEAIVKTMKAWRIDLANGKALTTEGNKVLQSRYTGPTTYAPGSHEYDMISNRWRYRRLRANADGQPVNKQPLFYVNYTVVWT